MKRFYLKYFYHKFFDQFQTISRDIYKLIFLPLHHPNHLVLLYIDQQIKTHAPQDLTGLLTAVKSGAVMRVRPKLMTVITIIAGLIPIFVSEGLGSDVMRRIALPMLGGMVSTAILTLIVIPVVYFIWESRHFRKTITTR